MKQRLYFENYFQIIKKSAEVRRIIWKLTTSQVEQLFIGSCFYCGAEPAKARSRRKYSKSIVKVNGIDRLDNKLGYTITNSVSCCKFCNYAKRDFTLEEFINNIKRVYNYLKVECNYNLLKMVQEEDNSIRVKEEMVA